MLKDVVCEPDYRDGRWYPCIGGTCPVLMHDNVLVLLEDGSYEESEARLFRWDNYNDGSDIVAFRVFEQVPNQKEELTGNALDFLMRIGLIGFRFSTHQAEILHALYDAGYLKEPNND